jgi:Secretion system C-terminal sorting domain
MKKILLFIGLGINLCTEAQTFGESFADGNFTSSPAWTPFRAGGGAAVTNWLIVPDADAGPNFSTGSSTLRLNAPAAGTFALSTPNSTWGTGAIQSWGFWMGRRTGAALNANNRSFIWLFADRADVTDPAASGYRIVSEISAGNDELRLERVNGGVVTIIATVTGIPSGIADYAMLVKVVKNSSNVWTIYTNFDLSTLIPGGGDFAFALPFAGVNFNQGSGTDGAPIPITGTGYFAFMAVTGGAAAQRSGPEFDQYYYDALGALPVDIESFRAQKNGNRARLDWSVGIESNVSGYEVERSSNGVNFTRIGFVPAVAARSYSFTDESILAGQNFYRLKTVDLDASYKYSTIVRVNGSAASVSMKLFPNPVQGQLYIQHGDAKAGAQLRVVGIDGRTVQTVRLAENAAQTILDVQRLAHGVYNLVYDNGNGETQSQKFIKQ